LIYVSFISFFENSPLHFQAGLNLKHLRYSRHSTTPTSTLSPTRPTHLHPYVRHARFLGEDPRKDVCRASQRGCRCHGMRAYDMFSVEWDVPV